MTEGHPLRKRISEIETVNAYRDDIPTTNILRIEFVGPDNPVLLDIMTSKIRRSACFHCPLKEGLDCTGVEYDGTTVGAELISLKPLNKVEWEYYILHVACKPTDISTELKGDL